MDVDRPHGSIGQLRTATPTTSSKRPSMPTTSANRPGRFLLPRRTALIPGMPNNIASRAPRSPAPPPMPPDRVPHYIRLIAMPASAIPRASAPNGWSRSRDAGDPREV